MSIELKPISKTELIEQLHAIEQRGWIENTTRTTNDGAAGNKLEDLLGIPENNLPIPNGAEWELKTQRDHTTALLTLFHLEPSPRALNMVAAHLLPYYGWTHKEAGKKYPSNEKSFRGTLCTNTYTRGFHVEIDRAKRKISIQFDASKVSQKDADWLQTVRQRIGHLQPLDPAPYWGFDDLFGKARTKLLNCFFVQAEMKKEAGVSYFHYYKATMLRNFNIDKFIDALEAGLIYIDFDARTGHNHGTKFRLRAAAIADLYEEQTIVMQAPKLL